MISTHILDTSLGHPAPGVTVLLEKIAGGGGQVSVFAIDGYWLDIGRHADYQRACNDFGLVMARADG